MNVIIHDLTDREFQTLFPNTEKDTCIISDTGRIRNCIGCFGCWIKTPGKCVLKDGYEHMGELLSKTDKVIIISQCYYGGYSPFVKNVLDRSISILLPFFVTRKDETHHKRRYKKEFELSVFFYGDSISQAEMEIAKKLVKANCVNMHVSQYNVHFYESLKDLCREEGIQ